MFVNWGEFKELLIPREKTVARKQLPFCFVSLTFRCGKMHKNHLPLSKHSFFLYENGQHRMNFFVSASFRILNFKNSRKAVMEKVTKFKWMKKHCTEFYENLKKITNCTLFLTVCQINKFSPKFMISLTENQKHYVSYIKRH